MVAADANRWRLVAAHRIARDPQTQTDCIAGIGHSEHERVADRLYILAVDTRKFRLHRRGERLHELHGAGVSTLVIQGERDTMGRPEAFPEDLDLAVVPGADHGFKVPAKGLVTQAEAMEIVVEATLEWIIREVLGNQEQA